MYVMNEKESNWTYIDSPWDLLRDCRDPQGEHLMYCILSHILGILSVYIFPFISTFGLVTNCLIVYVFLVRMRDRTRQTIYLASLAIADSCNLIAFGWFWVFPAKGLPYASNANVYYFTFNISPIVCKLHRFVYSFTSCLACNLFLLTVIDRFLSIYFPLKFSRIRNKAAWINVGVTILASALLMLPFGIATGHFISPSTGKIICWLDDGETFLQLYHVLLSNCGFIQTMAIIAFNLGLMLRLKQAEKLRTQLRASACSSRKEMAACRLLLILSSLFVIGSVPQSAAYMCAFIFQNNGSGKSKIRFAYNISDIGWHLFFIQESINWIVYVLRMPNFRRETKLMLGLKLSGGDATNNDGNSSIYIKQDGDNTNNTA